MSDRSSVSVTVYTREGCHLCSDAIDTIRTVSDSVGRPVDLTLVDVDEQRSLREAYGERVPYVFVDGQPKFKFRIDVEELKTLLEA